MKTIVCGPPHSGKSIFISNLVRLMPSESFQRITANGDGEGTWSNNPIQQDVLSVRKKGTNNAADFKFWRNLIDSAKQQIVLVDIGGRLQEDKIPLFEACDSFIVVSNSDEMTSEWKKFGEQHGCKCIATVLSVLADCVDEVLDVEPYVRGRLSGLERGHDIHGSKVLSAVAEAIVKNAGYEGYIRVSDENDIDIYDIGRKLGCSTTWLTSDGIEVGTIWYTRDKAKALRDYLTDSYAKGQQYRVFGAKSLWVASIVTVLSNSEGDNLEFYDEWTDSYISSHKLRKCESPKNEFLDVKCEETEDSVLVKFETDRNLDSCHFAEYELPEINETKILLLSGRFPNWFVASVLASYSNPVKYVHVPGVGYLNIQDDIKDEIGHLIPIEG